MRTSRQSEIPAFPIEAILRHLGAEDVPTGFGWVRIRCPFCSDRNGSASVNHEKTAFRCHQCDRHGDSLKLLQSELNLSFIEALELARQITGIDETTSRPLRKRRASELLGG